MATRAQLKASCNSMWLRDRGRAAAGKRARQGLGVAVYAVVLLCWCTGLLVSGGRRQRAVTGRPLRGSSAGNAMGHPVQSQAHSSAPPDSAQARVSTSRAHRPALCAIARVDGGDGSGWRAKMAASAPWTTEPIESCRRVQLLVTHAC